MYLLFDIGGTKTRIALSRDGKSFEEPRIVPTPTKYEEGINTLASIKKELAGDIDIVAAIGSIAASFSNDGSKLTGGGMQIKDWLGKPIKQDIGETLGCPVHMANDTMMGGLAQSHFGPAQGYKISVYVTVSTGVGGAIIVDGKIDDNTFGFEPGWQIIDAGNALCNGWSEKGYLTDYISGMGIERNKGVNPKDIHDEVFWQTRADFLAMGLHNVTMLWSPAIITVGGSIMKSIDFAYLEKRYRENISKVFPNGQPVLKPAEFGDEMGLYGALAYVKMYGLL